jgi:hypothetical protein
LINSETNIGLFKILINRQPQKKMPFFIFF